MIDDDDFLPRLSRSGQDRSFASEIRRAVNLAQGSSRSATIRGRFTGARIGRGAGVGRILAARDGGGRARARRVIVKARIVRLAGKGAAGAVAHLRYLQRDGTTREGERGALYGPADDTADGKAFLSRGSGDRHQFRFIVAAEDGAEYDDLKPLIRRLMTRAENDLGTKLDWMAVDHFNTGHPHSHVIVRGKGGDGRDLVIAPEYMTRGLRVRAGELVDLDLGPGTDAEIARTQAREIDAERYTSIDRRLSAAIDAEGLVPPAHRDGVEQAARAGRLQTLGRMGLAVEEQHGRWRLDDGLEMALKAMGRRGDIIATMNHEMARHDRSRNSADYAIYDPLAADGPLLVGRVLTTGLSDEHADRRYLILESTNGLAVHVDAGLLDELPSHGSIVQIQPAVGGIREVDRTIAEVATANQGRYSVDLHLRYDASATETFATTHVRRLEALKRQSELAERTPDGSWVIVTDHLERVAAHERKAAERLPVRIDVLASRSLDQLAGHDGATWLDRELTSANPLKLERGFGAELRRALGLRRQWLVEQGLARASDTDVSCPVNMVRALERGELARVGAQLSRELGLAFVEPARGRPNRGNAAAAGKGRRRQICAGRAVARVQPRAMATSARTPDWQAGWRDDAQQQRHQLDDRAQPRTWHRLMRKAGACWLISAQQHPSSAGHRPIGSQPWLRPKLVTSSTCRTR